MNRTELLTILKSLTPGISKGQTLLAGTDTFHFMEERIITFNDALSISIPFSSGVKGSVKALELVKVLEKMKGDELSLSSALDASGNPSALIFSCGKATLRLKAISVDQGLFSSLPAKPEEWLPISPNFFTALSLALFSVSKNMAHGLMTGLHIEQGKVYSTDNTRATVVNLEMPDFGGEMGTFTFPAEGVEALLPLSTTIDRYSVTQGWVHFRDENWVMFSSRILGGTYPVEGFIKVFPPPDAPPSYTFPEGTKEAVRAASVLSDATPSISLSKEAANMVVRSESDCGSYEELVSLASPEDFPNDLTIVINPKLLLEVLELSNKFGTLNNGHLVVFANENFRHILATQVT